MSVSAIRNALETALAGMSSALPTQHENDVYTPVSEVPYQQVWMLWAPPENPTLGDDFKRQRGIMQVDLRYPLNRGARDAQTQAEAVQTLFKRGLSLTANSVTTTIETTPEIVSGRVEGDRFVIPVKVKFFANIG